MNRQSQEGVFALLPDGRRELVHAWVGEDYELADVPEYFFNHTAVPFRMRFESERSHHRRASVENGDRLTDDVAGLDSGPRHNPWDER